MKTRHPLVIVDYGLGNLFSIDRALRRVGAAPLVSRRPDDVAKAERVILPGVGAFGDGMRGLKENGLIEPLKEVAASGRPLLGICLGMQLLLDEGAEFGVHQGLGLIPGKTVPFPRANGDRFKIPHVGWNALAPAPGAASWAGTILQGLPSASQVYFVHSFIVAPAEPADRLAETVYGGTAFCSALRRGSVQGCQFHPEKSGPTGLAILAAFSAVSAGGTTP